MDPHFIGHLRLEPSDSDPTQLAVASKHFSFFDENGVEWKASTGELTGGAHIPWYFKPIIGYSFQEPYLSAATLHNIYCRNKTRSWRDTDAMFLSAMLVSGVNPVKARLMWSAVYVFGPHW